MTRASYVMGAYFKHPDVPGGAVACCEVTANRHLRIPDPGLLDDRVSSRCLSRRKPKPTHHHVPGNRPCPTACGAILRHHCITSRRRHILPAASHEPLALDPENPDILYGSTSSLWDARHPIEWGIKRIAALGLQGIEPYAKQIEDHRANPLALKKKFDESGVTLIDVSNGAKGQSTNFIDPEETPKTIADHVAFARDFLQPFGCDLWKCNMGARPPGGTTDDQLKRVADTLNEIGRQTIEVGIRLAPHPHIWGPVEREHEVRAMLDLTDPDYVWLTPDTGHLVLGGMDAVQIMSDYLPRIAEVHLKDTYAKYRGNKATPAREQHAEASVYHNMGGGGVDFPAVMKLLRDRHYKGWVVFDMDGPRKGDDGFDAIGGNIDLAIDDYLAHNVNYLRVILGVRLQPLD